MRLSVGLARIISDPELPVITRRALAILSTPSLLVNDNGLTIDGSGRIALRLKEGGGLIEDEDGLSVEPPFVVSGVINVDGVTGGVTAGVGVWNIYMSGTASNYFAGSVLIGTTTSTAKLTVRSTSEQLRLEYDALNYVKTTVGSTGNTEIQPVGTNASLNFVTSGTGGIQFNSSAAIVKVMGGSGSDSFFLDGSIQSLDITVSGVLVGDYVFVGADGPVSTGIVSWSPHVISGGSVRVRIVTLLIGSWSPLTTFRVIAIRF
jgi:hypothetical protein